MSYFQKIKPSQLGKVKIKIAKSVIELTSMLLAPVVKKIVKGSEKVSQSPVFIVGAPRTGSTALYQALTNSFNVTYIDNLAAACYRNLPTGIWLSKKLFGLRPHNNFKADFGDTLNYGWHAPSECGRFWYRWFPLEDHFLDTGSISEDSIQEIYSEVSAAQSIAGIPLLFKNLNAGQRLRVLSDSFPQARIIYIKRDPRFTAASIIKARESNNIPAGEWWSVKPKNFRKLMKLEEEEMVVAQVYYLEKQIEEDLALFESRNVRIVHYNELCEECVESLGEWLGLARKAGGSMPDFFQDSSDKMNVDQKNKLTQLARNYPFSKDAFV